MTIRITSGSVTVSLGDQLDRLVEDLVDRAQTASVRLLRQAAREVAAEARARWYGPEGVQRRTGASGDIQVSESIDLARGEIRISVGSTDRRVSAGRPVPSFVHRPGRTSTVLVDATPAEWYAAPRSLRGPWRPGPGRRIPQLHRPNPAASDGRPLLPILVTSPMRRRIREIAARLGEEIARGE